MPISDVEANELLDHLLETKHPTLYFALFDGSPGTDMSGPGIEISGSGYARAVVAAADWDPASGRTKANADQIAWPTAGEAWGDATHFAIFDDAAASLAANLVAVGSLTPVIIGAGQSPLIGAQGLVFSA